METDVKGVDASVKKVSEKLKNFDFEQDFNDMRKKKKKKRVQDPNTAPVTLITADRNATLESEGLKEPIYTYEFLLDRVYSLLNEANPNYLNEKKKFSSKPPTLERVGTKKTRFTNFMEICNQMNRPAAHLMDFIFSEFGNTGSLDASNQLMMKGRFDIKQVESILRKYIREYVFCQNCKSSNTTLLKEARLSFVKCNSCGSKRSVASVKTPGSQSSNK